MAKQFDYSFLQAALIGFTAERDRVQQAISELEKHLGGRTTRSGAQSGPRPKRKLSAGARQRIADAQTKRWAAYNKGKAAPAAKPKRRLSAAAKAKLVA